MKTQVDRESVKMLALSVGVREAARKLGLNENRVLQWSRRGQWFKPTPQPPSQRDVITVIKPADALAATLSDLETETRLSLAKASRRMAKDCEELPVRHADKAYTVAKTMAIVHRQDQGEGSKSFTLNVLNLGSLGVQVRQPDTQGEQVGLE